MDFEAVKAEALAFRQHLTTLKAQLAPSEFEWYPYDTMSNIYHLDALLTGGNRMMFESMRGTPVADIGAADGDLGFFLERTFGCSIDLIDNGPTNFNGLRGARRLRAGLGSDAAIHEVDLDSQFSLPGRYRTVLMLGLLYHLKNPFYVLERLAESSELCLLSTRIAEGTVGGGTRLRELPVAYLLDPDEANNDSTNYWIFSETGLRRIFDRTGWDVLDFVTVGCREGSDPASPDRDERAFCLLRSRRAG